jgi:hypothetical protein
MINWETSNFLGRTHVIGESPLPHFLQMLDNFI